MTNKKTGRHAHSLISVADPSDRLSTGKTECPFSWAIENVAHSMPAASRFLKNLFPPPPPRILTPSLKQQIQLWIIILAAALILGRPAAADSPFTVDVWSTADRLPENAVIALAQTRDGYLWAGTQGGLARFDGNTFTPFNVNNTPGLPDNVIVFLYEDSRTNFWVGTHNGFLCLIQNGTLRQIFNVSGARGKITAAYEDKDGTLWFATDMADVFNWHDGALGHVSELPDGFRGDLYDLARHVLLPNKDGSRWILKSPQVQRWRGDQLEKSFPLPWGTAIVTAAREDDAGNLVVGTRGDGVFWFDADGNFQHITKDDGLSSPRNFVLSLCFDSEKNLWVGTDGDGLDRVRKKNFTAPLALSRGTAQSMAEDAQGGLWTAFNLGGLTYWLTNSAQDFQLPDNRAWTVLVDGQQKVWAGTHDLGLYQLRDGSFQPVLEAQAAGGGVRIFSLFSTREGKILVGSEKGLAVFDGQGWSLTAGLPKSPVRALAQDTNGNIWIGTETEGLFELRDGKISKAGSHLQDVSALLADTNGGLWVGSVGHGLAWRSETGDWKFFSSTTNGLANDDIGSLAADDADNLWIGSYEGLVRVEKKSFADVISGAAKTLVCRTFLTRECSAGAQPAAIRAHDGRLWFPTLEGVVAVNPADLRPNTNPPPVVVESVLVDGVELKTNLLSSHWSGTIRLKPANEQLDIRFASLNFSAPKGVQFGARFRYQLEETTQAERGKNWTDIGTERVAHFQKLPSGSYTFHVQACNEDGVWNETGASVAIVVEPPFWRQPGFITTGVLSFLGVLAGTIYLISTARLRRQLRLAQQKEMIEHERARIARDLHDQLGANLTQITLLGEMAETDKDVPAEIEEHSRQICATARETTRSLDEIVWAVNPSNDTIEGLVNYACKYAQDYFAMAGVSYRADLPPGLPPIPILPEVRHNVFLAFKEAVNNVVKHAHATEAHVKLQLEAEQFILSVSDNGRGVGSLSDKKLRNGLTNMRRRLADVHGKFDIAPGAGSGTVVKLTVPINGGITPA
jgi:signal transduction histidine kinase